MEQLKMRGSQFLLALRALEWIEVYTRGWFLVGGRSPEDSRLLDVFGFSREKTYHLLVESNLVGDKGHSVGTGNRARAWLADLTDIRLVLEANADRLSEMELDFGPFFAHIGPSRGDMLTRFFKTFASGGITEADLKEPEAATVNS